MLCKFTRADGTSGGPYVASSGARTLRWGPGVTHQVHRSPADISRGLCTDQWIHYYGHTMQAVMLDHGGYQARRLIDGLLLWKVKVGPTTLVCSGKYGAKKLTTIRKIAMPKDSPFLDTYFMDMFTEDLFKRLLPTLTKARYTKDCTYPRGGCTSSSFLRKLLIRYPIATQLMTDILNRMFPEEAL